MRQHTSFIISRVLPRTSRASTAAVFTLLALAFFSLSSAMAQSATGTIAGYVTDQHGGTLPKAEVSTTDLLTNRKTTHTTDTTGHYEFLELQPGSYAVSAKLSGFQEYTQSGIAVHAGSRNRVDIPLPIGSTTEQVTVSGDETQVDTETAEVGTTVTAKQISDLPLNGRDAGTLVLLVPGTSGYYNTNAFGFQTTSVNAGSSSAQNRQVDWLLDGGLFTWTYVSTGAQLPNPDALEEFHFSISQRSAEYGRTANGTVNSVIRSGSNAFHGRTWEFYRSAGLNAKPYLSSNNNPKLVQHQFGGTLGGPIVKDKLFFFGSYEGFRQVGASFTFAVPVPTAAERMGDFSASTTKPVDPQTQQRYTNDQVAVDPVSAKILAWVPEANTGNGLWSGNAPNTQSSNQYLGKVDYNLTHAHHLSGSFFDLLNTDATIRAAPSTIQESLISSPAAMSSRRMSRTRGPSQQRN